jgi:hypothetical protein
LDLVQLLCSTLSPQLPAHQPLTNPNPLAPTPAASQQPQRLIAEVRILQQPSLTCIVSGDVRQTKPDPATARATNHKAGWTVTLLIAL